jgi:alpha-tubulin suppressor-like RCC1 family protein
LSAYNFTGGASNAWNTFTYTFTAAQTSLSIRFGYSPFGGTNGNLWNISLGSNAVVLKCNAGTSSPTLSAITKANACPTTTVDLTTITASNMPAGATLTWHTGTPATTANKITGTAVAAGTYYAAFFDATNNCYSGTSGAGTTAVTATVNPCLVQSDKCGFEAGDGCSNTDYSNFGLYSNNNPATIEYDNMVSVFHSTIVRNSNGSFSGWGAHMANDGTSHATTPRAINATNYPALGTHKILKVTGASWSGGNAQFIALTSDGLYAWGGLGFAISSTLKNTTAFGRVANTNGSSNLPPDVTPADVKMITASNDYASTTVTGGNIVLTTCGGAVWVIGTTASARGNGATGNINTWYQVMKAPGVPLTNIVSARINHNAVLALDSNNTLWTWGSGTFLGNNSFAATRNYATQMEHPAPSKTIKMIGMTRSNTNANKNYYVLMTDGNLYSLGQNAAGELGIWNTAASTGWVQPRYTSSAGPVMNDIKWISPNENDNAFGAINVINSAGVLYAWGNNNFNMLGFPTTGTSNPGIPSGLSGSQKIIAVETGGHTSMVIRECSANFGYVGHSINGSMANGSTAEATTTSYTFATAPVNICGALAVNIIPVGGTENIDGSYCIDAPPTQLTASTPGGTWSIVSGPATITSTGVLTFSGIGTVIVNYVPPVSCNQNTSVYTIEVKSPMSITAAPTAGICVNSAITPITLTTGGVATGATATGLPPGLTGTWASNVFTISGTPTTNGTYTYTVATTGPGCDASTTGTLTVITCLVQTNSCGFEAGDGCSNTDYSNFGLYSNNDAATIEYDNFVSAFHSTVVRNSNGSFSVWGQEIANNGISNVLVPQDLSSANYPALGTHKVLKVTIGSNGNNHQAFALTSNGLFTWGVRGLVVATSFTPTPTFARMANTNGSTTSNLPPGVTPADVKMLTASTDASTGGGSLVITTCSGNVWVLGLNAITRGNGSTGTNTEWSQVQTSAGNPLTGIVAARVQGATLIALKNDNTLWTWGKKTYLGNGSAVLNRNFATQMEHPDATKTIKMIGVTGRAALHTSYYVLMTDGNLYALGDNTYKQLGDWTITDRTSWVQPRYTSAAGPVMNDIQWISVNESDSTNPSVNAITKTGQLYAWGESSFGSIGRGTVAAYPGIPNGIAASDKIIAVETGGHTTMVIKECASSFGYVGHRINGSMANGTASDGQENTYTFNTSTVDICGAQAINIIPNGGTQNAGSYCIDGPPTLSASPSGGTWVVASGPATITSTGVLTFTDVGTVIVNYTGPITCNQNTSVYSLTAEYCCPVVSPISN